MSLLDTICSHCWLHSINELQLNNLIEALIYFKTDEKYYDLLSRYEFNENKISNVFVDELAELLVEQKVIYDKNDNSIFITMTEKQIDESYNNVDPKTSKLVHEMLNEYRLYNTKKSLTR